MAAARGADEAMARRGADAAGACALVRTVTLVFHEEKGGGTVMIYGFDTSDEHAATAALLVYAVYSDRPPRTGPI